MLEIKRPTKIQTFNDGVLSVHEITRTDDGGESLTVKHALLRYEERTVGISRYYSARQENAEITMLLRVMRRDDISTQDIVVLHDGRQYTIRQVQYPRGIEPPCCDLSLERVTHNYDVK